MTKLTDAWRDAALALELCDEFLRRGKTQEWCRDLERDWRKKIEVAKKLEALRPRCAACDCILGDKSFSACPVTIAVVVVGTGELVKTDREVNLCPECHKTGKMRGVWDDG